MIPRRENNFGNITALSPINFLKYLCLLWYLAHSTFFLDTLYGSASWFYLLICRNFEYYVIFVMIVLCLPFTKNTVLLVIFFSALKFIYSEKATKILQNLPLTFDYSTYGQKLGEDFAKFCGLLRIYELYYY